MGVLFDKLHFMKRLEDAGGFTRPQAEALSEAFHQAVGESVATKEDVEAARQETVALRAESTHQAAVSRTELASEASALRTAMENNVATLRIEAKHDIATLRTAMENNSAMLRAEVKTDIAALRTEVKNDIDLLRSETKAGMSEVRGAISEAKVWAVSVGATVIAVLASIKYFG